MSAVADGGLLAVPRGGVAAGVEVGVGVAVELRTR